MSGERHLAKFVPTVLGGDNSPYELCARFGTAVAAPLPATVNAAPGPGILTKVTDSGNNASITADLLRIAAAAGDTDPGYLFTKGGAGIVRAAGKALIIYNAAGTAWAGWENTTTLSTAGLVYGAKGRSAVDAGALFQEALAIGNPTHILILDSTGCHHICRKGTQEYYCWHYAAGADATLWPALLGSVADYDAFESYPTTIPTPFSSLTGTIAQGATFTHPINANWMFEVTVTTRSSTADTRITVARQDDDNRLFLNLGPSGVLDLYRRVLGVQTKEASIFGVGGVANGGRLIVRWVDNADLVGAGGTFQVWSGANYYSATLGTAAKTLLANNGAGVVSVLPADCTLNSLYAWTVAL